MFKALRWSHLSGWRNNRLIRTSYVWIVVVPLAAKALLPVAGEREFTILGASITVDLSLPFSWQVFFFMSLAFAAAQAIYAARCPHILRDYVDFASFRETQKGVGPLVRLDTLGHKA